MQKQNNEINRLFEESSKIIFDSIILHKEIESSIQLILKSLSKGKKIVTMGNGGSAMDAQHMASEFIGRYLIERKSIPSISLTSDSAILTALGNDYGFDTIFKRQCESLIQPGDVVIAISTSGKSKNILDGIKMAKKKRAKIIGLTGKTGGKMTPYCDILIKSPSNETPRIQESHRIIIHIICELVEKSVKQLKSK